MSVFLLILAYGIVFKVGPSLGKNASSCVSSLKSDES